VIAEPDVAAGECELVDGHAFYDPGTNTWHYISQMYTGKTSSNAVPLTWNINHYSFVGEVPLSRFTADSANPVVKNGQLWSQICGPTKSCPNGTNQEGTPEIIFKLNGYFYVTFHGVFGSNPFWGYRGIAKTADFHRWLTYKDDALDSNLPDDALWSKRDCAGWHIAWSAASGCVGGGHASVLITPSYTYMLIESSDLSLACSAGQNWVIGLVRTPIRTSNVASHYIVETGRWQEFAQNPLINAHNNYPCSIQYPRFFVDRGNLYLSYWTMETVDSTPFSALDDRASFFRILRLEVNSK